MNSILTIDPGIKHTGWAHMRQAVPLVHKPPKVEEEDLDMEVLESSTIYRGKGVSATSSIRKQSKFFKNYLLDNTSIDTIVIEDYVLYRPSKGAGNALKLVGALVSLPSCIVTRPTPLNVTLVTARHWKGWLQKTYKEDALTKAREYAKVGSQHEADAICLGVFYNEYLKDAKLN